MRAVSDTRADQVANQLELWPAALPKSSFEALETAIQQYQRPPNPDEVAVTSGSQPQLPFRRAIFAGALVVAVGVGWAGGWATYHFFTLASPATVPSSDCRHPSCKRAVINSKSDPEVAPTTANTSKKSARDHEPARGALPALGVSENRASLINRQNASSSTRSEVGAGDNPKRSTMPVPETKPMTIEGWAVREVVGATAILEGPNGIFQVKGGDAVPGVGRVESIVRWGNRWIVVTARGLISTPN